MKIEDVKKLKLVISEVECFNEKGEKIEPIKFNGIKIWGQKSIKLKE